jgi:uncharacterized protein YndB with AHSA1/START domain
LNVEPISPYLEPLEKTLKVGCTPSHAFEVFTDGIGRWWPLALGFSISGTAVATCAMEPRVGGELYETAQDGTRHPWGRILAFEPPHRLVFTWHPGRDAASAQEVEVRFAPEGGETRVTLVHRDWQKLGEDAAKSRAGYDEGWGTVLGKHFAPACG